MLTSFDINFKRLSWLGILFFALYNLFSSEKLLAGSGENTIWTTKNLDSNTISQTWAWHTVVSDGYDCMTSRNMQPIRSSFDFEPIKHHHSTSLRASIISGYARTSNGRGAGILITFLDVHSGLPYDIKQKSVVGGIHNNVRRTPPLSTVVSDCN